MSIESVMLSNHCILCHPLLLPSIFPRIRIFSSKLALRIRWPKYWGFSFSINTFNKYSRLSPLGGTGLISLQSKGFSRVFPRTTVLKDQFLGLDFFMIQVSHPFMTTIMMINPLNSESSYQALCKELLFTIEGGRVQREKAREK